MGVQDPRSQEAQHGSGVILRSIDRETMQAEYHGRKLNLDVDRAPGDYLFYLPSIPTWDDGDAVTPQELNAIMTAVVEIERHWGATATFQTVGG